MERSIMDEVVEVNGMVASFLGSTESLLKEMAAIVEHPSYKRVMEMSAMLEAFSKGQPKPTNTAAPKRKRRTLAEIEADKLAGKQV